jgi:carbon-monoxide dehydrogenase small subunit
MLISLTVNGTTHRIEATPMKRLLDVLRQECRMTGTKEGCGEGECGACSVIVNGELVNSCLVPICQMDGADILTVEGLAQDGRLHPLQQAFWQEGAAQCGICTPGLLMAALAILDSNVCLTPDRLRQELAGNLCRCTGYSKIIRAIQLAFVNAGAKSVGEVGS